MHVLLVVAVLAEVTERDNTAVSGLRDVVSVGKGTLYAVKEQSISVFSVDNNGQLSEGMNIQTGPVSSGVSVEGYVAAYESDHLVILETASPTTPVLQRDLTLSDTIQDVTIDEDSQMLFALVDSFLVLLNLSNSSADPVYLSSPLPNVTALAAASGSSVYFSDSTSLSLYDFDTATIQTYNVAGTPFTQLYTNSNTTLLAITKSGNLTLLDQYVSSATYDVQVDAISVVPGEDLVVIVSGSAAHRLSSSLRFVDRFDLPENATKSVAALSGTVYAFGTIDRIFTMSEDTLQPPVLPPVQPPTQPAVNTASNSLTLTLPDNISSSDDESIVLYIIIPLVAVLVVLCVLYVLYMYCKGKQQPTFDDELRARPMDQEMAPSFPKPALKAGTSPESAASPALGPGQAPAPAPGLLKRVQERQLSGESGRTTPIAVEAAPPLPPLAKKVPSPRVKDLEKPVDIEISYSHYRGVFGMGGSPNQLTSPSHLTPLLPADTSNTTVSTVHQGSPRGSEYNASSPFYSPPVIPNPHQSGVILDTQTGSIVMSIKGSPSPLIGSPQRSMSPLAPPPSELLKELNITKESPQPHERPRSKEDQISVIRAKQEENERLDKILELARVGYDVGGLL